MINNSSTQIPLILAIDTSCDETSAAITLGPVVLTNIVASQIDLHKDFGGVYPTVAKQAHQKNLEPTVKAALRRAGIKPEQLDFISVTLGPGLAPALETGINYARKIAKKWDKPLLAINHIEAHLLSVQALPQAKTLPIKKILEIKKNKKLVSKQIIKNWQNQTQKLNPTLATEFPVLSLIFSGGHSQFVQVNNIGDYQILGQTVDDAAGEALDKVGRMLNLGYPAAPVIEKLAKEGNEKRYKFPLPMTTDPSFNLSYSGLKTAAAKKIEQLQSNNQWQQQDIIDFAASFQFAVFRHICYKLEKLLQEHERESKHSIYHQVWLGGGVAKNMRLRQMIRNTIKPWSLQLKTPYSKKLCGDNAAMIGVTASYHLQQNNVKFDRKPSWSLKDLHNIV